MSRLDRRVWAARWLAPLGWAAAAVLLALSLFVPVPTPDPPVFAWALGLSVIVALIGHLLSQADHQRGSGRHAVDAAPRAGWRLAFDRVASRLAVPRTGRGRYKGHSHAGGRPRFD
jgi:hypothetical protein